MSIDHSRQKETPGGGDRRASNDVATNGPDNLSIAHSPTNVKTVAHVGDLLNLADQHLAYHQRKIEHHTQQAQADQRFDYHHAKITHHMRQATAALELRNWVQAHFIGNDGSWHPPNEEAANLPKIEVTP